MGIKVETLQEELRSYIEDSIESFVQDVAEYRDRADDFLSYGFLNKLEERYENLKDLLCYLKNIQIPVLSSVSEYLERMQSARDDMGASLFLLQKKRETQSLKVKGMVSEKEAAAYSIPYAAADDAARALEDPFHRFSIRLGGSYLPADKISVIKAIRSFTKVGLKEAKDMSEALPQVFPGTYNEYDYADAKATFRPFPDLEVTKVE